MHLQCLYGRVIPEIDVSGVGWKHARAHILVSCFLACSVSVIRAKEAATYIVQLAARLHKVILNDRIPGYQRVLEHGELTYPRGSQTCPPRYKRFLDLHR